MATELKSKIRDVPDFPKPGIVFKDIMPLLGDPDALRATVDARKPGKLPWNTVSVKYALEYGFDALEVHADSIIRGQRVLVHDDVLATGGTARAKCELVEQLGGEVVGVEFIIALDFLDGRERLSGYDVHALISYE